jgi:hypothetical protein
MTITPSDQLRQSEIDGKPNLLQSTEYAPTTRAVDGDIDYVHFDSSKTLKAGSGAFQSSDIVTKKKAMRFKSRAACKLLQPTG